MIIEHPIFCDETVAFKLFVVETHQNITAVTKTVQWF